MWKIKVNAKKRIVPFKKLEVHDYLTGFKSIAVAALDKMQQADPLSLLSTPTHLPAWIDPVVLVKKLVLYQQRGETPDDMDFQLALQRCALDNTEEASAIAGKQLTGELRNLMLFLLDSNQLPEGKLEHPAWWMTAGITRSPGIDFKEFKSFPYSKNLITYFSDNMEWETYMEEYLAYGNYNPEKKVYDRYPDTRPALKINMAKYKLRDSGNLLSRLVKDSDFLFLEYLMCLESIEQTDFQLTAIPNTPDAFYAYTSRRLSAWGGMVWEVAEQQLSISVIQTMRELETPFREMHYLLLVCCLTGSYKPSKDYALDIWTSRVASGAIDNTRLGTAIGKYVHLELVPLKRFTDLLASSMIGISTRHNKAALEVVEGILSELNPEPIKNLKKLLEIYKELLALNSTKADFEKILQLSMWENEKSLKKLIAEIGLVS